MNRLMTERAARSRTVRRKGRRRRDLAAETRAIVERANGHLFMALVLIEEARRIARRVGRGG